MAPSASRRGGLIAALLALFGLVLAGCETTQDKAARLHVRSKRTLASREPLRIQGTDESLRVTKTTLLRSKAGAAIAVSLRNTGDTPVNDLPLAVGVETADGGKVYLNRAQAPYFQGHAPALAPGAATTWVFTSKDSLDDARTAFAKVGRAESPPITEAATVPELPVAKEGAEGAGAIRVRVDNPTAIPQYDLAVYAWASKAGREVAAGRASIEELDAGQSATATVRLVGDPSGATLHSAAPPTIFQ